jgi:hypothetical protein
MRQARREVSAYFLHEADARRASAALDSLFHTYIPEGEGKAADRWLLTIVLPTEPSLATLYVDAALLDKVEELVERHGGALWESTVDESDTTEYDPDDEPGPGLVEEMRRRLATRRSQWVVVTAAERDRRSRNEDKDATDDEH